MLDQGACRITSREFPPFQVFFGRIGRGQKPPPQFGQTFPKMSSTHERQKVHSKEQIIASVEFGGSAVLQCSQGGLSSSIVIFSWCVAMVRSVAIQNPGERTSSLSRGKGECALRQRSRVSYA